MAAKRVVKNLTGAVSRVEQPQTGIPIIIRPFVVKKAYVVHPKVRAFQADLKAQWLTKTLLKKGLPSQLHENCTSLPDEWLKSFKEGVEKSLLHSTVGQKIGLRWKIRYDDELTDDLLQNMLMKCWSLHGEYSKSIFLAYKPNIATHWCRNHQFYQTHCNLAYVLRGASPLPVYEKDVSSTIDVTLPSPYSPADLKVFSHPTIKLPNNPGYHGPYHPTPYSHTMLLSDFMSYNQQDMLHHGIQVMFTQLVAIAMDQGHYPGQHLEKPLCTKCIITNGRIFLPMAYQLNTLSLQEDFGIKNIAWYEDHKTLYDIESSPFKRGRGAFYEIMSPNSKKLEINEDCLRTFLSLVLLNQK